MSLPESIRDPLQRVVFRAPFIAHLAMALTWRMDDRIRTACTDGATVQINPTFYASLSEDEKAGLLAHEALHCALRHSERAMPLVQTAADAARFNCAADIVVNGAIEHAGLVLPKGAIRDRALQHLSVEEIYRRLKKGSRASKLGVTVGHKLRDLDIPSDELFSRPPPTGPDNEPIDWPKVLRRADMIARKTGGIKAGSASLQIARELSVALGEPLVDWRSLLQNFLADCPDDWGSWDRRAIHRGQYLPRLVGRELRAVVGIDVSGSISSDLLDVFLTELHFILQSTERLKIDLYWTDTRIHGPETLTAQTDVTALQARGGGGTNLGPLFTQAAEVASEEGLAHLPTIYLTDGRGPTLDEEPPGVSALWIIPTHGELRQPWGTIVPMEVSA